MPDPQERAIFKLLSDCSDIKQRLLRDNYLSVVRRLQQVEGLLAGCATTYHKAQRAHRAGIARRSASKE